MLPASGSALVGGPRFGGALQPTRAAAQAPAADCDARVAALCNLSAGALDSEANGALALQKETESVRAECTQLQARCAAMRAAMATLVAEVDALGAADKHADSELQKAKAAFDAKVAQHQALLANEQHYDYEGARLEDEFIGKLQALEGKMRAAHAELEVALQKHSSSENKQRRQNERVSIDKLNSKLESMQDLIDQAKRRKLCMQIAEAEASLAKEKGAAA